MIKYLFHGVSESWRPMEACEAIETAAAATMMVGRRGFWPCDKRVIGLLFVTPKPVDPLWESGVGARLF